jgi:hypothetical protein
MVTEHDVIKDEHQRDQKHQEPVSLDPSGVDPGPVALRAFPGERVYPPGLRRYAIQVFFNVLFIAQIPPPGALRKAILFMERGHVICFL